MQSSQKVAFNTFVMYAKVLITVGVSLYSTRLILSELGTDDFGIFSLISGVVGMLAFLNISVTVAVQRYLAYTIGEKSRERYEEVYGAAIKIGMFLGLLLAVVIELLGIFFLDSLDFAPERTWAVHAVFHCMVVSTFFSVWAIPYEAAIVANEDIYVISLIYTVESLLKLAIAIYLIYTPYDKLVIYGVLLVLVYVSSNIFKKFYCNRYGCRPSAKSINRKTMKEMAKFSGWTSIEPLSVLFSVQGVAVLLNLFGGTVVNAAYGIANQVCGQMNYFSSSLLSAINPQIIKSEGMNNRERTIRLSRFACKLSFFLLSFFAVPLIMEMPFVLSIWLKDVPEYTVLFCRLILLSFVVSQLAYGLQGGVLAVGRIKYYQIVTGMVKVMSLPAAYFFLKAGFPLFVAIIMFVASEMLNYFVRLYFAKKELGLQVKSFVFGVTLRLLLSLVIIVPVLYFVKGQFFFGFHRLLIVSALSSVLWFLMFKFLILDKKEYAQIRKALLDFLIRIMDRVR